MFQGQRFVVFDWQLDSLERMLGKHAHAFDLPEFFFTLDSRLAASGEVLPPITHRWLEEHVFAEARKRGLPVAGGVPSLGKLTNRLLSVTEKLRRG
jgi:hypothetical protein